MRFTSGRRHRRVGARIGFVSSKAPRLKKDGTPYKKPEQHEEDEQIKLFNWVRDPQTLAEFPDLEGLYANANGGKRHVVVANRIKAMGGKAGVLDLTLPVARGGYHGLYLEMKYGKGRLSIEQIKFRDFVIRQGYKAEVSYIMEDAKAALIAYLRMPKTQVTAYVAV